MVEYALLTAGNALGGIQGIASRALGSIGFVEVVLVAGGVWLLWRIVDAVFNTGA
jgi:hypothetical protein